MEISTLTAISPVDGRYRKAVDKLSGYFSEGALIRYRVLVEVEYFIALRNLPLAPLREIPDRSVEALRDIYRRFKPEDARRVKEIEAITNHDVKAVEYLLKEKFNLLDLDRFKEFIHFGLTSQDVNNTAVPLSMKDAWKDAMEPVLSEVVDALRQRAMEWKQVPMLARTHGQPASPTLLGKEFYVFVERLESQIKLLHQIPFSGKFGGATGNFNAHYAAYPDVDWHGFANDFLRDVLGLERNQVTTQIEHYDNMAAFFDGLKRINTILLDLDRDVWTYISMNYFRQKIKDGEVGSSTMPHKVNPIDFENSEGNIGIANAMFEHLAAKLPVSRLQRDLTDSTVTRNIGVPFAHCLIAWKSLLRGMGKLMLNEAVLKQDLEANWAVVAEAIQTILRRENYPLPYETLKALTRTHEVIDQQAILKFVDNLELPDTVKDEIRQITPGNYIGKPNY